MTVRSPVTETMRFPEQYSSTVMTASLRGSLISRVRWRLVGNRTRAGAAPAVHAQTPSATSAARLRNLSIEGTTLGVFRLECQQNGEQTLLSPQGSRRDDADRSACSLHAPLHDQSLAHGVEHDLG